MKQEACLEFLAHPLLFQGIMIVIATRFIPLSQVIIGLTVLIWERSQWLWRNVVLSTVEETQRKLEKKDTIVEMVKTAINTIQTKPVEGPSHKHLRKCLFELFVILRFVLFLKLLKATYQQRSNFRIIFESLKKMRKCWYPA